MADYFANSKPTPTGNQTIKSTPRTLYANRNRAQQDLKRFGWDGSEDTKAGFVEELQQVLEPGVVLNGGLARPGFASAVDAQGRQLAIQWHKDGGTGELVVDRVVPVGVVRKAVGGEEETNKG